VALQRPQAPTNPVSDLLAALISGVSGASMSSGHGATTTQLQNSGVLTPRVTDFLTSQASGTNATKPKAYLNWILFRLCWCSPLLVFLSSSLRVFLPNEKHIKERPPQQCVFTCWFH